MYKVDLGLTKAYYPSPNQQNRKSNKIRPSCARNFIAPSFQRSEASKDPLGTYHDLLLQISQ